LKGKVWKESVMTRLFFDIPFWKLLVRLAAITDGMGTKLHKAVVELSVSPIESLRG
jgi:hypothetical protein